MITTNTADVALKSYYLDVLRNQLNTNTNPFYNKIVTTSKNIIGHKVVRLAPYALNGGFGFGADGGVLPKAGSNQYTHFETTTKDMYGVIEISDKAIKASRLNTNSFVDLLTQEMKGILEAAKFNYSRSLYTDGSGVIAMVTDSVNDTAIPVDSLKYLMEGMIVDVVRGGKAVATARIAGMNRKDKMIVLDKMVEVSSGDAITVQNSYQKEITGLGAILNSDTAQSLYGVNRSENDWMLPYISENTGAISDLKIQTAIDSLEENAGSQVDYISCSYDVRRNYLSYLELTRRNVDPVTLEGGFRAISFAGIPVVADRHAPDGTMDLLNSKSFAMHTLSDWDWLDDDGKILKQIAGKPAWTAVLAKYGELLCDHPGGQARLSGITA